MPMPLIAAADESFMQSQVHHGIPGQFATLVFLLGVIFSAAIFRFRLGLRYRLALLPLALMPLVSGIMGCSYDYLVNGLYYQEGGQLDERPLGVMEQTSLQTGVLLFISIGFLLRKGFAGSPES